jgi:hypothetical protein
MRVAVEPAREREVHGDQSIVGLLEERRDVRHPLRPRQIAPQVRQLACGVGCRSMPARSLTPAPSPASLKAAPTFAPRS